MTTGTTAQKVPGDSPPKPKVFISYARADVAFADRLAEGVAACGFEALIDRSEIYAFEDWWKRIEALIVRADAVVFVLSPESASSEVCASEIAFAASINKRLAPIVIRRVDDNLVPAALRRLNFVFFDDAAQFDQRLSQLAEALATDIDWVRKHTEIGEQALRWSAAGRPGPRGLLLRSPVLEEAERWISMRPSDAPAPTEETQSFIVESRRAAIRRRNVLTAGLGAGFLLAMMLAGLAYWQRGIARENEAQAKLQRDAALVTQSRFLADLARQQMVRGNAGSATLLALEALPDIAAGIVRPHVTEAESALADATNKIRESLVLRGHDAAVLGAVFSPDGALILTASADRTAKLWDSASGAPAVTLNGHESAVVSATFSPDGRRVLTASEDNTARMWDAGSGQQAFVVRSGGKRATFSPDGGRVLTPLDGGTALYDSDTGQLLTMLKGISPLVNSFSKDGARVITIDDKSVRVWNTGSGAETIELHGAMKEAFAFADSTYLEFGDGLEPEIQGAALSADGDYVVAWCDGSIIRVWKTGSGEELFAIMLAGEWRGFAFAPNGGLLGLEEDKTMHFFTFPTVDGHEERQFREHQFKEARALLGHEGEVTDATFSPDGKLLATASADKTVRLWDFDLDRVDNGLARKTVILEGHDAKVLSAAFSPDGKMVVTSSADTTARVWNAETEPRLLKIGAEEILSLPGFKDTRRVVFSPDGTSLLTYDGLAARVWDIASGREILQLRPHGESPFAANFSWDSRQLLTWSSDRTARLWDIASGRQISVLIGNDGDLVNAALSPDGSRVATTSRDGSTRLWRASDGKEMLLLRGEQKRPYTVTFSPDGKRIVTSSQDNTAVVWDLETGREIYTLQHKNVVYYAAYSPDGRRIITSSSDQTAGIWDAGSGKQLMLLPHLHGGNVFRAAFSPDSTRIITAALQGAQIWDANSGQPIVLLGHDRTVNGISFSGDGRLVMLDSAWRAHAWDIASGRPILTLDDETKNLARNLGTLAFSPDGRLVAADAGGGAIKIWRILPYSQANLAQAKALVPRCLNHSERVAAFLELEPPAWCIDLEKWPYQTADWKVWLIQKRAGADPPLPEAPLWKQWLSAHQQP